MPYKRQRLFSVSCPHLMPAGLPSSIPGIADESDGAMQHAPHPQRQGIFFIGTIISIVS